MPVLDPNEWRLIPRYDLAKVLQLKQAKLDKALFDYAELQLDGKILRYGVMHAGTKWRIETIFVKEPETINWLHSFKTGQILCDIGANIGMYSLYAAQVIGCKVIAFEPESQNYAELNRNIFLNQAHGLIQAYPAAIAAQNMKLAPLYLANFSTGGSFNDFAAPSQEYNTAERFAQGSIGFSLDYLTATRAVPMPDHIKIDVDGHEPSVLEGMRGLLASTQVKTLLLEYEPRPDLTQWHEWLMQQGWQINLDILRYSRMGLISKEDAAAQLQQGAYRGNMIYGRSAEDIAYATDFIQRLTPEQLRYLTGEANGR